MKILQLTHVLRVTLVCSLIKMHREGYTGTRRGGDTGTRRGGDTGTRRGGYTGTRRGGDTFPIISLLQCVVNLGGSACMHGEMKHPSLGTVRQKLYIPRLCACIHFPPTKPRAETK